MLAGELVWCKLAYGFVDRESFEEVRSQDGAEVMGNKREILDWCFLLCTHISEMIAYQQDNILTEVREG